MELAAVNFQVSLIMEVGQYHYDSSKASRESVTLFLMISGGVIKRHRERQAIRFGPIFWRLE